MLKELSYMNRYIISRFRTRKPVILTHMVTAACNCKCKICDVWRRQREGREMTTQEIFRMLDEAREMNFVAYVAWGGEPLLRPDILEILGYARDLGLYTCVTTNGFYLPQKADELADVADLTWVSLDHHTRCHDDMRGLEGVFERATAGIVRLRDAGGRVAINCVLNKLNKDCVGSMASLARNLGVALTFDDAEVFPGFNDEYVLSPEESRDSFSKVLEYKKAGYRILNSRHFIESRINGKEYPCVQPNFFVKVTEDGKATPFWCRRNSTILGDLRKQSLGKILNSSAFEKFARMAKDCKLCYNLTALEVSLFYSARRFFTNYYKISNPYLDFIVNFGF